MGAANWITVARIGLVPVFVLLAYGRSGASAVAAFVVFGAASLSDLLDGYIARRRNIVSRLGTFLDPLADKILIGAALVVLIDTRSFPVWAAVIIAVREIAIQVLRTGIVRGGRDLPASNVAKSKTIVQVTMVCWWLLPFETPTLIHWLLLAAALATTLWSGALYLVQPLRTKEVAG